MENTQKTVVVSIDPEQITREVCAESACLNLMSPDEEMVILSADNRNLINLYAETATANFVANFAGFIAPEFRFPTESGAPIEIPLNIADDSPIPTRSLRLTMESIVADTVLERIYEADSRISTLIRDRRKEREGMLRMLLLPPFATVKPTDY